MLSATIGAWSIINSYRPVLLAWANSTNQIRLSTLRKRAIKEFSKNVLYL